ncbi:O-antigen ligase family protein [Flavobacterium bizetiae]|uniref:O-antigen ligase family protein n=1 Tax=Flavobacterium bizetiae TaxID=2704140 RepID=UPI0021E74E6F|nr:O-antigen ligase family protein [Flavobacterium bizetiae]UTN02997.1 O-antigen ligase family protein [Flavobacterium bizetiae]
MHNIRTNANRGISIIPGYIVLLFVGLLLIIDFIPSNSGVLIANTQFLYLSVLNILIGVYFYMNSKMLSDTIFPFLKRSYITISFLLFLSICGLSFLVAKNESLVITRFTELLIVFCLFINLSVLLKDKLNLIYKIILIIAVSAFFQSGLALYKFSQLSGYISVAEAVNNMRGNAENINILAASLTIKIPFLFIGITHFKSVKKNFLLFTLFFVTTAIFLTAARTSLLNLIVITIGYIFYFLKINSFEKSSFRKSFILIIPIIISLFVSNRSFEKSKDNNRYISVTNRISQINTTDASAKARLAYWENTIKISQANPLLGIGLGNYRIESIPYEKYSENDFSVSLDSHNDFLEIFAETGVINGILYFSLFIYIFFINIKWLLKSNDDNTKRIAILCLMLLIVYGGDAFFNFPMYRPTMQIFFSLLLALTLVNSPGLISQERSEPVKIKFIAILIGIAIMTSYSAFIIYKASDLEAEILKDDINNNLKGILSGDEVVSRIPKYPNVFRTSESFYEYAAIYYIREKKYDKALTCFARASKINPYSGRINFYKYIISKEKNNLDSASVYIKEAFYLRPRNLFYYKYSTNLAAVRKDTIEILKESELFSKYRKITEAWSVPAAELQKTNFNKKSLIRFVDQGLKQIPNDSTLIKLKNDIVIKDYILEGQILLSQSKFDKSLESFEKALKINPNDIYLLQSIGLNYYYSEKYKEAIPYFLNALKYPGLNNGITEFYVATCYLKNNDLENACEYFNLSKAKSFRAAEQQLNKACK